MKNNIQISNKIHVQLAATNRNLSGVEYAVYPCVLLVQGVHHGIGSEPVYYSDEVLAEYAANWNNVPVTIGHPVVNGDHVLCGSDGTIRQQWEVGSVRNATYEEGKLKGEIWLNKDLINENASGLLEFLENGGELDVSTGLLAGEDGISGSWNSENYSSSVLEIIPDHLALLPGGTGACSWNDGCGVRVNAIINQGKKHTPIFCEVDLQKKMEKIRSYVDSLDVRNAMDDGYLKANYVRAIYDGYFVYNQRADDGTETLYRQDYIWSEDGELQVENTPVEVTEDISYKTKANEGQGEVKMKKNEKGACCPEKVKGLIANEQTSFTADDQEWLESLNEAQLEKVISNAEQVVVEPESEKVEQKANSASEQITDFLKGAPAQVVSFINEGMRTLDEKRAGLITAIANANDKFTEKDLVDMPTGTLEGIANMIPKEESKETTQDYGFTFPAHVVANAGEEEEPYVPQTLSGSIGGNKE